MSRRWAWACVFAAGAALAQDQAAPVDVPESAETKLLKAWQLAQAGELAPAQIRLEALLAARPNFHLGWLLYGDVLSARSGGRAQRPLADDDPKVAGLLNELQRRLITRDLAPGAVPDSLISVAGKAPRIIVMDLAGSRLFLLERGEAGWQRLHDWYAGIGRQGTRKREAGDFRTPIGIYQISGSIRGTKLPDLYGSGALTLNYPNSWDRAQKRDGHGIWIHGVPRETYVRAPQSSEGCVTLANEDFRELRREVAAGTPVILTDELQWLSADEAGAREQEWLDRLEAWRNARLSDDRAGVQNFYAEPMRGQVLYHSLEMDQIRLFRYPGEGDTVLAQFRRTTGRHLGHPHKILMEQFWRREGDGPWRIVLERER